MSRLIVGAETIAANTSKSAQLSRAATLSKSASLLRAAGRVASVSVGQPASLRRAAGLTKLASLAQSGAVARAVARALSSIVSTVIGFVAPGANEGTLWVSTLDSPCSYLSTEDGAVMSIVAAGNSAKYSVIVEDSITGIAQVGHRTTSRVTVSDRTSKRT